MLYSINKSKQLKEDIILEAIRAYRSGKLTKNEVSVILGIVVHKRAEASISDAVKKLVNSYLKRGLNYV